MGYIMMDTEKVKKHGQDLMTLSNNLNEQLNGLFRELENLERMGVWIGSASQAYSAKARSEKIQYYNLKDSIYKDGKTTYNAGVYMETEMRKLL